MSLSVPLVTSDLAWGPSIVHRTVTARWIEDLDPGQFDKYYRIPESDLEATKYFVRTAIFANFPDADVTVSPLGRPDDSGGILITVMSDNVPCDAEFRDDEWDLTCRALGFRLDKKIFDSEEFHCILHQLQREQQHEWLGTVYKRRNSEGKQLRIRLKVVFSERS